MGVEQVVNPELRSALLDLFPGDDLFVDEFLSRVNATNREASTRIARAVIGVETEEVVEGTGGEAVEEVVETEEAVEAEDNVEVDEAEIVLGETFVSDLVNSDPFKAAMRAALEDALEDALGSLRSEFERRFRSLEAEKEVAENDDRAWKQDKPARVTRKVVSYRPSTTVDSVIEGNKPRTLEQIAKDSVSEIFG
jgi:hypothetical protein